MALVFLHQIAPTMSHPVLFLFLVLQHPSVKSGFDFLLTCIDLRLFALECYRTAESIVYNGQTQTISAQAESDVSRTS